MASGVQPFARKSPLSSISISRRVQPGSDYMRGNLKYRGLHTLRWVSYCFFLVTATASIACAAPAGPPIRTGLWVTQKVSGDRAELDVFANSIRANHQLTGVCLHIPWNQVEKESGKPDLSAVDNFVAVLRDIGMKYQLGLKPGASTPA